MKGLLTLIDETPSKGLIGFSLLFAVILSGGGGAVLGGLWITWSFWESMGFPTMLVFRAVAWIAYWPGLVFRPYLENPNDVYVALISFAGWFALTSVGLVSGRWIRLRQGKAWRL